MFHVYHHPPQVWQVRQELMYMLHVGWLNGIVLAQHAGLAQIGFPAWAEMTDRVATEKGENRKFGYQFFQTGKTQGI